MPVSLQVVVIAAAVMTMMKQVSEVTKERKALLNREEEVLRPLRNLQPYRAYQHERLTLPQESLQVELHSLIRAELRSLGLTVMLLQES